MEVGRASRATAIGLLERRSHSAQDALSGAHHFVRDVVTGEAAKRLRAEMRMRTTEVRGTVERRTAKVRERLSRQEVVKFFDKTGFMLGVLGLISTEFVFLRFPAHFKMWFAVTIPTLIAVRWYLYCLAKYQFFLYDFCYFVQAGLLFTLFVTPESRFLWRLHFVLAHGPLLWAIPTWRNGFVFHSLDKVTSVFIHLFPALLTYIHRWELPTMCDAGAVCMLDVTMVTLYPLLYYCLWQALYILKTEVLCKAMLDQDPGLVTSVRWLANDRAHPLHRLTTRACRRLGVLRPEEALDPEHTKTKVIFWAVQLLYTLLTFLPVKLAFDHQWVCTAVLSLCFCICVWNGANYYIEVFAARYTLKFAATNAEGYHTPPDSPGVSSEEGTVKSTAEPLPGAPDGPSPLDEPAQAAADPSSWDS